MNKPNVLFLNNKEKQCGIHQYGERCGDILKLSEKYNFIYADVNDPIEYFNIVNLSNPIGIIYNSIYWSVLENIIKYPNIIHYYLYHEDIVPHHIKFNYFLMVDSTFNDIDNKLSVPRPLVSGNNITYTNPQIPTISSFGLLKMVSLKLLKWLINNLTKQLLDFKFLGLFMAIEAEKEQP